MSEFNFRIALLASGNRKNGGGGSTAERVARDTLEGKIALTIGVVVCNNPRGTVAVYERFDAINAHYGLEGDKKIEVVTINSATHPEGPQDRGQTLGESSAICRLFEERDISFAAMVGYVKILNGEFIEEWGWQPTYGAADPTHNGKYHWNARISNNHPGILDFTADTHGPDTHDKAVALYKAGLITRTAMTYHLAAAGVDTGAVFYEEPVSIFATDDAHTLELRVQGVEQEITASTLHRHLMLRAEHLRGHS